MTKKKLLISSIVLIAVCALLLTVYWLGPKDMSGAPYSEIEAYRQAHPKQTVTYKVTIEGGAEPLIVTDDATAVTLTDPAQTDSMTAQAEYLQGLTEISFGDTTPDARQVVAMASAFPNTEIRYQQVVILGETYAADTTELTLTAGQTVEAAAALPALPKLTVVHLDSAVTLDEAAALYAAAPHLTYHYSVKLFGQTLSTDMETVEFFKADIGDEGLTQLRKLLPMMHELTYLKLDWCGTSNEATAQLRDDYADRFKVVWRVFMGDYNCLTDTYKIWANYITTEQSQVLKYCTEVRYMDVGHSRDLVNIDFVTYMPNLNTLIIADCQALQSIKPLASCTKLEYLEIYGVADSDLTPLANLTELEHLNISRLDIQDLSPLDNLTKLKRLWATNTNIPKAESDRFKQLHPDCEYFTAGHPVFYEWRYSNKDANVLYPRYALLRKQIGYGVGDISQYPKGYVTEEITYESTGIKPV